ncbi:MAG: class I SAM-dependent methyltransferase [Alphaproteobacteria bacterium]
MLARAPLVPEIRLYLATKITPIWRATEDYLARAGIDPPYWAFAWAGGQALARHILDSPELVRGKAVLDFGAGSGLVALAAARAGAIVTAADTDRLARAAITLNAAENVLDIALAGDVIGTDAGWDAVLVGDMFYERALAARALPWLRVLARRGALVLAGDPGRAYKPEDGIVECARHDVPTTRELEDRELRETVVWRLTP